MHHLLHLSGLLLCGGNERTVCTRGLGALRRASGERGDELVDSNVQGSTRHSSNADPLVAISNGAKSGDCELCESTIGVLPEADQFNF